MSRPMQKSFFRVVLDTLGWALLGGLGLCFVFYALIFNGIIDSPFMHRYFAGHPVEFILTGMFCVGVVAILIKANRVLGQFAVLNEVEFAPRPEEGQPVSDAAHMVATLRNLPSDVQSSYFVKRLASALDYIHRKGSVVDLDEQLKHLSDQDSEQQYTDYALVRIIIWATPMLGFLGTVIGITMALANLSPTALVQTPEAAMEGLLASLSVAFDTTALALTLSVVLMFLQFIATQLEGELLTSVDRRVESELVGRFQTSAHVASVTTSDSPRDSKEIDSITDAIVSATKEIAAYQTNILRDAIVKGQSNWDRVVNAAVQHMQNNVDDVLRDSTIEHVQSLARAEEVSSERVERRWKRVEDVLLENAKVMREQQAELARQGDFLLKTVESAKDVRTLQHALNKNLESLTYSQHFSDTLTNLTGAVNMLASRVTDDEDRPTLKLFKGVQYENPADIYVYEEDDEDGNQRRAA